MAKKTEVPEDVTDGAQDGARQDPQAEAAAGKDQDGVPYCVTHHCRMKVASGGRKESATAYYACPVPGCDAKAKMIKTKREQIVPPQPQRCPTCSTAKAPVYCARDDKISTPAMSVLVCPECGWRSTGLARPELVAAHEQQRKRRQPEELGAR